MRKALLGLSRLGALAMAAALASCSSESSETALPAETQVSASTEAPASDAGPLDDLPDGLDIDDLDPELLKIYDDGQEMQVDEACELATELDLNTAQLLTIGALLEDPSLGQAFLDLADAQLRQGYGETAEERLQGFDDETDAGEAIDENC